MIYETENNILRDIDDCSVIMHQVNCSGVLQPGIAMSICKQYPSWYQDYHGYCKWFADGHEDEILGTFHRHQPDPKRDVLICSVFAQMRGGKYATEVDLDAWEKVLKKVKYQTARAIRTTGKNWTIHVMRNIGSSSKSIQNEELMDLFNEIFGNDENVHVYIHTTR